MLVLLCFAIILRRNGVAMYDNATVWQRMNVREKSN